MAQRPGALHTHRLAQHFGGHKRIAVAIAADPRADAQEGGEALILDGWGLARQFVLERPVNAGKFREECVIVIGEAVGDFVEDLKLGLAQHISAPERQNGAAQPFLALFQFLANALHLLTLIDDFRDL